MINWYPGHMTKAMRMIEENLRIVDAVIYVLDARAPYSCINPNFESMLRSTPVIYVINKCDTGDPKRIEEWRAYLSSQARKVIAVSANSPKFTAPMLGAIKQCCGSKIEKYRNKGVRATVKCMVLGVPNTGKSTVINNLCKSAKTVTGNKAGVTRGKQWVRVNDWLEVLDTPGTLYPKLSDQRIAKRLAYIGSIKDEILDVYELACNLSAELNAIDENIIVSRYGIDDCYGDECMKKIAAARGYLLKGGEPDSGRAAIAFIDDFRKGRLGAITLDSVKEIGDGGYGQNS